MSNKIAKLFATFFYVGYSPVAPGTAASAVGVLIYVVLHQSMTLYLISTILITIVGFAASGKVEKELGQKDPSCVVIDEVSGMLIALFMLPINLPIILTTFFLFRAFDMFKTYPINKLEEIKSGVGIMVDDVVAGLYTNIVMHIAIRLSGII